MFTTSSKDDITGHFKEITRQLILFVWLLSCE